MWYNMLGCDNKEKIKAAEIVVFFSERRREYNLMKCNMNEKEE